MDQILERNEDKTKNKSKASNYFNKTNYKFLPHCVFFFSAWFTSSDIPYKKEQKQCHKDRNSGKELIKYLTLNNTFLLSCHLTITYSRIKYRELEKRRKWKYTYPTAPGPMVGQPTCTLKKLAQALMGQVWDSLRCQVVWNMAMPRPVPKLVAAMAAAEAAVVAAAPEERRGEASHGGKLASPSIPWPSAQN